jgi:hypothetical protein
MSARTYSRLWLAIPLSLAACNTDVTNPGPVPDNFLNDPAAHKAMVAGMGLQLSTALNILTNHTAALTYEITPSGLVGGGASGIPVWIRQGVLNTDETTPHWNGAQQARWVAEDGLRRLREALGAAAESSPLVAQAAVYAGYANRLLGENMCQAVIDGGPAEPRDVYFRRAITAFNDAAEAARKAGSVELERAAFAGRATVHVHLNEWPQAVDYAGRVPTDFAYRALNYDNAFNQMWYGATTDMRVQSVWNTFFETYYTETADPRTPWAKEPNFPVGGPAPEGRVTWYPQRKYTVRNAPINLATGREMRLIEAENVLRNGDWQGALTRINALRAAVKAPAWTATNSTETWTRLKRERFIELWLEGRRLGDVRRWTAANTPGGAQELRKDSCFPIPDSELDTNKNL